MWYVSIRHIILYAAFLLTLGKKEISECQIDCMQLLIHTFQVWSLLLGTHYDRCRYAKDTIVGTINIKFYYWILDASASAILIYRKKFNTDHPFYIIYVCMKLYCLKQAGKLNVYELARMVDSLMLLKININFC